jgi:hypothetical protein
MSENKTYQVTYKIYHNNKIKQVSFHGKMLYPLYVQLIYDRKNTVYKSNLFNLFLKPRYGIRVVGELFPPPIEEVIRREETLIEFVINKHSEDFSFELFKKDYDYYSRDLLDEMEPNFLIYLHTFFQDEGSPYLADSLNAGAPTCHAFNLVSDLKRTLKPDLYQRLIDHSFAYALPYLPLARFADREHKRTGLTGLSLMDWENTKTKEEFGAYLGKHYSDKDTSNIVFKVEKFIKDQMDM